MPRIWFGLRTNLKYGLIAGGTAIAVSLALALSRAALQAVKE